MKNNQWRLSKILTLSLLATFTIPAPLFCQISQHRLHIADSLFQERQFTQSAELYESILANREYTPALLLRLAYIHEGLNQIGDALYYLNLYYQATRDPEARYKIKELAEAHQLAGYDQEEMDVALAYYQQYHTTTSLSLAVLLSLCFGLALYLRWKKRSPLVPVILSFLFVAVLAVHVNLPTQLRSGIISLENSFIMSGPSSGADVVSVVSAGHRVRILGTKDVWTKIEWNGAPAYIKSRRILSIEV